jgi:hypothetical protein
MLSKFKNVLSYNILRKSSSRNFNYKFLMRNFVNSNENKDSRYHYDYESPEQQDITLKSIGYRIAQKIIILSSFILICYLTFFRKYNKLAKRYQYYFINDKTEHIIADKVSVYLKKRFNHCIYKQDQESEEVKIVFKIYENILRENRISLLEKISTQNIFIVDFISIGCFLNKNGDLFISNRILDLADNQDEIALFIGMEVANNLIGGYSNRILKFMIYEYLFPDRYVTQMKTRSFLTHNIDKWTRYNRFLLLYPESVVGTYYEEVALIQQSLKLLNKAKYNVFQAIEILRKFEEKMKYYPRHYTELVFVNRESRYYDGAKNFSKIYLLNKRNSQEQELI